jgi:adenosylcobinamide kinase/adenosylcobinamide-phosphate guanylyltransferase
VAALLDALPCLAGRIILVSNEVGWGVVPANDLARRFTDEQGRLNQRIAALCGRVTLTAAGLPLELKPG